MNSNIAFILVDKEKRIIGISSSCISMLYLDLHRLERINYQGITLNAFSQDIQLKKDLDKQYLINWNLETDFERQNTKESKNSKSKSDPPSSDNYLKLKTLHLPKSQKKRIQLICKVESINMNDIQGDIGHYIVRLDFPEIMISDVETKPSLLASTSALINHKAEKKKTQKPIPDFFFKIDGERVKFVRDIVGKGVNAKDLRDVGKNTVFLDWQNKQQ